MKKLVGILSLGLCMMLTACSDDESRQFVKNEDGEFVPISGQQISEKDFLSKVVGYGWNCIASCPFDQEGRLEGKNLYDGSYYGMGFDNLYFKTDSVKRFGFVDAYMADCFTKEAYTYMPKQARVHTNHVNIHIISVDAYFMKAVTDNYWYCRYRRMTTKELANYEKNITINYDSLSNRQRE
jgi:hypothetical protein